MRKLVKLLPVAICLAVTGLWCASRVNPRQKTGTVHFVYTNFH